MVQQARVNLPRLDISDGTIIEFKFNFGNTTTDIKMPDRMEEVKVMHVYPVFVVDGTVCMIERVLLNEGSAFDFGSYNNVDAVDNYCLRGSCLVEFERFVEFGMARFDSVFEAKHSGSVSANHCRPNNTRDHPINRPNHQIQLQLNR